MRELSNYPLPSWQKINYNLKRDIRLELIVQRILSEKLPPAKYINRAKTKQIPQKLKLTPISEHTEFIILEDQEFTQLFKDLET
jgi:hypothetical protein